MSMKLFIVHCGFYDPNINAGLYEGHTNFFVAAEDFTNARAQAKNLPEFKKLKMHIDGIQEIVAVSGYRVDLKLDPKAEGKTQIRRQKFGSTKQTLLDLP